MKGIKFSSNAFDRTTEMLDIEFMNRVKKLSDKEFFIYMCKHNKGNTSGIAIIFLIVGLVLGIIL